MVQRDVVATAYREIHEINQLKEIKSAELYNKVVCILLRCITTIRHNDVSKRRKGKQQTIQKVIKKLGVPILEELEFISDLADAHREEEARERLTNLLAKEKPPKDLSAPDFNYDDYKEEKKEKISKVRVKILKSTIDGEIPGIKDGMFETKTIMRILLLEPMKKSKKPKTQSEKPASAGSLLRVKKLAAAAIAPTSNLFIRRIRVLGGTILIDASGSMGITTKILQEFCSIAPMATVAYYDGYDGGETNPKNKTHGTLRIFAKNGKEYTGTELEKDVGGNGVDHPALLWLLNQREPRIMVTDAEFCGGYKSDYKKAKALLVDSVEKKKVQWVKNMDEAIILFGNRKQR
jgi:hypothetical protein